MPRVSTTDFQVVSTDSTEIADAYNYHLQYLERVKTETVVAVGKAAQYAAQIDKYQALYDAAVLVIIQNQSAMMDLLANPDAAIIELDVAE